MWCGKLGVGEEAGVRGRGVRVPFAVVTCRQGNALDSWLPSPRSSGRAHLQLEYGGGGGRAGASMFLDSLGCWFAWSCLQVNWGVRLSTVAAVEKFIGDLAAEAAKRLEHGGSAAAPLAHSHSDPGPSHVGPAVEGGGPSVPHPRSASVPGASGGGGGGGGGGVAGGALAFGEVEGPSVAGSSMLASRCVCLKLLKRQANAPPPAKVRPCTLFRCSLSPLPHSFALSASVCLTLQHTHTRRGTSLIFAGFLFVPGSSWVTATWTI